jgi:hypothetical protein
MTAVIGGVANVQLLVGEISTASQRDYSVPLCTPRSSRHQGLRIMATVFARVIVRAGTTGSGSRYGKRARVSMVRADDHGSRREPDTHCLGAGAE